MSNQQPEKSTVFAKCKRGTDQLTKGQNCDSTQAENLTEPGSHASKFKCKKCNYLWTVPTGGSFNIF